ncbi:MAG TPA: Fe-S protein assembly co-chaperone HscB, partial [Planctomycetota bacterium]|nr:Fe-S protein assembly co-chaperone HscB [Planctomycetota bacterium]
MTATGAHDPFLALGVPPRLDLDEAELERRVLDLQRRHHPDRVPPEEREAAEARAADVNAAYRALRSPLARAKAWLELRGVRLDAFRGGPPGPLAMRGFEIQEAAEELRAGDEKASETLRALERAVAA